MPALDETDRELLARYVKAFEAYDMEALTSLIHEDATQSMPPFDMWLSGRDDIFTWWFGPGAGCRGSKVVPTVTANGSPAFAQYKPNDAGDGYVPWALQVLEVSDGRIVELHVLPRDRDDLPALRRAARDRGVGASVLQHVPQAHEGDQLEQLLGRVAQPRPGSRALGGELELRERIDRDRIGSTPRRRKARSRRLAEQRAHALAQAGQVGAAIGPRIANAIVCGTRRAIRTRTVPAAKLIDRRSDR